MADTFGLKPEGLEYSDLKEGKIPKITDVMDTHARTLRLRRPTEGHSCIQPWLVHCMGRWVEAGLISWPEYFALGAYVGTTLDIPDSPYAQSRKEPDFFFRPQLASALPANALKWAGPSQGTVSRRTEIFFEGAVTVPNGNRRKSGDWLLMTNLSWFRPSQSFLFLNPNPPYTQRLEITYGDVFSSALQPGRNPRDILYLDLDSLRDEARYSFGLMNLASV
ncbi:uncharacterized protein N7515_001588 [Penicillium bovifimosum]|uniref:Uncharacterized protein n=1 Tax=Penicillium bovifimosum TaxID=126998 RepID=A0A9W9L8I4_9EURO|nr:uncharacterized protein N7515_001588 [Penicillium bovifimosum]KAJ5142801.1 hypothetical protein N7515_001588 [Penicillium bovifimosum]